MQRLELCMEDGQLHQPVHRIVVGVALPSAHGIRKRVGTDGNGRRTEQRNQLRPVKRCGRETAKSAHQISPARPLPLGALQDGVCRGRHERIAPLCELVYDLVHGLGDFLGRVAAQVLGQRLGIQLAARILRALCLALRSLEHGIRDEKSPSSYHTV